MAKFIGAKTNDHTILSIYDLESILSSKYFICSNVMDIEIIWQTHLLRPMIYQADCLRLFRRVIDHSLLLKDVEQFSKDQAFCDTCQLYEQRFGESYCPLTSTDQTQEVTFNDDINPIYSYWDRNSLLIFI
jgi:hypothetical protein